MPKCPKPCNECPWQDHEKRYTYAHYLSDLAAGGRLENSLHRCHKQNEQSINERDENGFHPPVSAEDPHICRGSLLASRGELVLAVAE